MASQRASVDTAIAPLMFAECMVIGHGVEVLAGSLEWPSESATEACGEDSCAVGVIVFGNGRGEEAGVESRESRGPPVAVERVQNAPHQGQPNSRQSSAHSPFPLNQLRQAQPATHNQLRNASVVDRRQSPGVCSNVRPSNRSNSQTPSRMALEAPTHPEFGPLTNPACQAIP